MFELLACTLCHSTMGIGISLKVKTFRALNDVSEEGTAFFFFFDFFFPFSAK